MTVDLQPYGERDTLMTITHTLLPDGLVTDYREGWTSIAHHFADFLDTR